MIREKSKWWTHKDESTDAGYRGGTARKSDESPVMGVEQRGGVIQY
jgi:hypothetical protein